MSLGLSTYAYFWRMSDRVPNPLTLDDTLRDAADHGVDVFQICDHPPLEGASTGRLMEIAALASELGLRLEIGTRGTSPGHLRRFLRIARALDVRLVRSMWTDGGDQPDDHETERRLREVIAEYADADVTLALETYEQVSTQRLVDVIGRIDDPHLGVCLDPANTVANLELPDDVVARCAPWVKNWHVKDFDFTRSPGWVGFQYTGVPIGTGRLHYDDIRRTLQPDEHGINQIIEFWLPWQGDPDTTIRLEAEWTTHTIEYIRSRDHD